MINRESIIKGLECCMIPGEGGCDDCPYLGKGQCQELLGENAIALLKAQEPITGETSDGYHTFNELYHHRAVLFSVIVANYPDRAWKSKKHHDGTMYNGMFIVGIDTPDGQATYHYDINPYWDMFDCKVCEFAPKWDGHTPAQAIERIGKLKAQEAWVMTLEKVEEGKPYWLEMRGIASEYAICKLNDHGDSMFLDFAVRYGDRTLESDGYGKTWRCWTSRPTAEQMEGTPWE